jgi:hypothetical protein
MNDPDLHPGRLAAAYARGENIIAAIKARGGAAANDESAIEVAYDLQAGSYTALLAKPGMREHKVAYGAAIAAILRGLGPVGSLLEAGIGEGTTASFVMRALGPPAPRLHGFDLSWSRIACCRRWLAAEGVADAVLSVASLSAIPYADASFDVVYTSHTIEPNGGRERGIIAELARVAARWLVLVEPGYELAGPEAQARMASHGYCRALPAHAEALGLRVVEHRLLGCTLNPLNPSAVTVIAKDPAAGPATPRFRCPRWGDPLDDHGDALFSPGSLLAYPRIGGIPCLRPRDGIVASGYLRPG